MFLYEFKCFENDQTYAVIASSEAVAHNRIHQRLNRELKKELADDRIQLLPGRVFKLSPDWENTPLFT